MTSAKTSTYFLRGKGGYAIAERGVDGKVRCGHFNSATGAFDRQVTDTSVYPEIKPVKVLSFLSKTRGSSCDVYYDGRSSFTSAFNATQGYSAVSRYLEGRNLSHCLYIPMPLYRNVLTKSNESLTQVYVVFHKDADDVIRSFTSTLFK